MDSEDRFNKMSYEELVDFAVLHGLNVTYTAILELVNRGPDKADYLLRYIKDRSYWVSDSFNFKVIPESPSASLRVLKEEISGMKYFPIFQFHMILPGMSWVNSPFLFYPISCLSIYLR